MKKLLVVLLSAMLVLGLAASAMADVTLSGDARVRGISKSDYDFNGDVDTASADYRYWDQRVRLNIDAKAAGDVMVKARVTLSEGTWSGAANTGGSPKIDDDDYAYIVAPVGPVTVHIGRQLADWGNKFTVWNSGTDRLKVIYKASDTLTLGALTDKKTDVNDGDNGNDYDDYALLAINKFGSWTASIIGIYYTNNTGADDITGQVLDIAFNGPAGPVNVVGEFAYKGGDIFEGGVSDSAQMGGFIHGDMNFDAINVGGALAFASEEFVASKWFTPTLFFGTSQPTAIMEYQGVDDGSSFALVGAVSYKASDALKVGGKIAYLSVSDENGIVCTEDSCSAFEIDATLAYKISDSTSYSFDLGYLSPSDMSATDDAALGIAHKIEVKF